MNWDRFWEGLAVSALVSALVSVAMSFWLVSTMDPLPGRARARENLCRALQDLSRLEPVNKDVAHEAREVCEKLKVKE